MKRISFFSLLMILMMAACKKDEPVVTDCLPAHLNNGLIASYSFSNGSLDNGESTAGQLTNNNGATLTTDRDGNADCAYFFNINQDQFLSTASTSFLDGLNSFSVSVWYHPMDSARFGWMHEVLVGRNSQDVKCPDRRGEWSLGLYDCRKAVFGHNNSVWVNDPFAVPLLTCEELVNRFTGTWQHAVAVYDNNNFRIYYNGILHDSDSGNAACNNLQVAQDLGDLILGRYYTGKLDDVLIYDRALTDQEVYDLFVEEGCCAG